MAFLNVALRRLSHGLLNEADERVPPAGEVRVEVVGPQRRGIDEVRANDRVENGGGQLGVLLQYRHVLGRGDAADGAVGLRGQGSLVDDALATLVIDVVVTAPLLREDVVYVDLQGRVLRLVECFVEPPVTRSFGEDEGIDSLVRSGVPGAQGV